MHTTQRRCPILVESKGQVIKSHLFASDVEQPADISMKIRDEAWAIRSGCALTTARRPGSYRPLNILSGRHQRARTRPRHPLTCSHDRSNTDRMRPTGDGMGNRAG